MFVALNFEPQIVLILGVVRTPVLLGPHNSARRVVFSWVFGRYNFAHFPRNAGNWRPITFSLAPMHSGKSEAGRLGRLRRWDGVERWRLIVTLGFVRTTIIATISTVICGLSVRLSPGFALSQLSDHV